MCVCPWPGARGQLLRPKLKGPKPNSSVPLPALVKSLVLPQMAVLYQGAPTRKGKSMLDLAMFSQDTARLPLDNRLQIVIIPVIIVDCAMLCVDACIHSRLLCVLAPLARSGILDALTGTSTLAAAVRHISHLDESRLDLLHSGTQTATNEPTKKGPAPKSKILPSAALTASASLLEFIAESQPTANKGSASAKPLYHGLEGLISQQDMHPVTSQVKNDNQVTHLQGKLSSDELARIQQQQADEIVAETAREAEQGERVLVQEENEEQGNNARARVTHVPGCSPLCSLRVPPVVWSSKQCC